MESALVGVVGESSAKPAEFSAKKEESRHSRSIGSSRNEASNTSSNSTIHVVSSSAGQGQGVLAPVSYPSLAVSSVPVRGEAAESRRWKGEDASETMEGEEPPFESGGTTGDWD